MGHDGVTKEMYGKELHRNIEQLLDRMKKMAYRSGPVRETFIPKQANEKHRKVMKLVKNKYVDFGPTLASEKLQSINGLKLSAETLRKWLIKEGIWRPKRKKEARVYQRRTRRGRFGELLQGDGSPHDWFEGRGDN